AETSAAAKSLASRAACAQRAATAANLSATLAASWAVFIGCTPFLWDLISPHVTTVGGVAGQRFSENKRLPSRGSPCREVKQDSVGVFALLSACPVVFDAQRAGSSACGPGHA